MWASDGRPYLVYWDNGEYSSNPKPGLYATINGKDVAVSESEIIYPSNWQKPEGWGVAYDPFASTTPSQAPTTSPEPTQEPIQEPTQAPTQQPEVHTHTWVNDTYSVPMWSAPSYHTESFNICNYCYLYLGKSMEESDCGHGDEIDAHMKAHFDAGASTGQVSSSNGGTRYIFDEDAYIDYIPFEIKKCECGEVDYSSLKEILSLSGYTPCVTSDQIAMAQDIYNKCGINKTPDTFDSAFDGIKAILNS